MFPVKIFYLIFLIEYDIILIDDKGVGCYDGYREGRLYGAVVLNSE